MYASRPARQSEIYTTSRFPSGSIGLVSAGDRSCAICVQYDTRLELTDIPAPVRERYGLGERETVVFARIESGAYHDGVALKDGGIVSLQQIGPGVTVAVEGLLEKAEPVKEPALAE
jgi:bifunctional DNA-binding transcriptional regulator/antitoxin component of YhaV-PrlF toxin-antitoxin module